MSVFEGYRASTAALAASTVETITFSGDQLPKAGIAAFHFVITGTGKQYNSIDRTDIKVGGKTVVSITQAQLRLYLQRFSRANESPADADTSWTIPFYLPDEKGDRRYEAQLEPGDVTVEVITTSTINTGTLQIAWSVTDVKPKFYTQLLRAVLNVGASDTAAERNFKREGLIRGFSINTTGLNEVRVRAGGVEYVRLPGTQLIQVQRLENNDGTTNPVAYKLGNPVPGNPFDLILNTGATWAGTANEFVTYGIVPVAA